MYSSDLLPIAIGRLESGKRSMMAFLEEVPHLTLIDITDGSLRNVNTPEEYAVLVEDYGA